MNTKRFTAILAILSLFLLGGTAVVAGDSDKATTNAVVSTFEVNGMTCGGCSSGLRLQVKKLEGIEDIKVSPKDILKAIEKMGFEGKLQKTEDKA